MCRTCRCHGWSYTRSCKCAQRPSSTRLGNESAVKSLESSSANCA
ncbi:Rieske 2Fe-2S domain-containing protein [Nocardia aobensis]